MKFFVYGTLKEGGHFAKNFDGVRKSNQPAKLKGFDLFKIGSGHSSWFPGVVAGKGTVIGEVHEYNQEEAVRGHMDRIEGYNERTNDGMYLRTTQTVELEDGTTEEVYVYVFNGKISPDWEKVESGDWEI